MRSPTETAHLVDSHYSRSFGRPPDNEMREFIRNAAEHGLARMSVITARFSWLRRGRFGR